MPKPGDIVKAGTWTYGGIRKCRVEIQYGEMRYGTGDIADPSGDRNDRPGECYHVSLASPLDPGNCPPVWKFGHGHATLEDAVKSAETTLSTCDLKWQRE